MNILDFANPLNLWWGLLALPIIALYILKVRLRRIPTSTLLFWNQLYDEKKPRSWLQRLRHWLSLLLQLAFLGLVVAALIDPLWSWQKETRRSIVLVLDNSASMQAIESSGQSRLELAKQSALLTVQSLRDGDQMAIVSAGGAPQVVWGMTNHQRWLSDAIESIPAYDAPSKIEESLDLANRLLSGIEGEGETVVFTDGCSGDLESYLEGDKIAIYGVGEAQDNVGITRFQVRRSVVDAIGYQVLVDVTNFSESEVECRLELDLDSELVDVLPLKLAPDETLTRIVNHTSAVGGTMTAKLDHRDAMAVDNIAAATLPTRKPIPIRLYTVGNLFVGSALTAIPLVDLDIQSEFAASAIANQIHVFDQKIPQALPPGRVFVIDPQNDTNLWKINGDIDQPIVANVDEESPLTQQVKLTNVLFPGAKELEFSEEIAEIDVLVSDPYDSPLLARIRRPDGDVIVLTCSLEKGDLPLRIAFPVLMKNTIEWFEGHSSVLRPAAAAGDLVTVDVERELLPLARSAANAPEQNGTTGQTIEDETEDQVVAIEGSKEEDLQNASESDVAESEGTNEPEANSEDEVVVVVAANESPTSLSFGLQGPDGSFRPVATGTGQATIGPLLRTGLWKLQPIHDGLVNGAPQAQPPSAGRKQLQSERDQRELESGVDENADPPSNDQVLAIACNLVSAEESNLRPSVELPPAEYSKNSWLGGRSIWFYLTLVAAGLIAGEWWLYQRRIVG